ncbi:MAG: hypothetical protein BroJett011_12710 [Chloroflexota bacterium]|nr:MAG: hypothetical protein BroJett011_12710 [Chloroflexota bacterium]
MSPKTTAIINLFKRVAQSRLSRLIIHAVMIPLLLLSVLLFPPLSLADRLLSLGYERIDARGGAIRGPDGVQIAFLPAGIKGSTWVKLEVAPDPLFLASAADRELRAAAGRIPSHLAVTGPLYRFKHRGAAPAAVVLTIPLPAEAGQAHILDLYTWTGQAWEWLPHRQIPAKNVIEAELAFLPQVVAVMRTQALKPSLSTNISVDPALSAEVKDLFTEITGLVLDANGHLTGDPAEIALALPNTDLAVIPTLRNWDECHPIYSNPIDALLIDPELRQRHNKAIVKIVQSQGYQGIELDYRGLNPDLRQEYTTLVTELRQELPADKRLYVQVELPRQMSTGTWDTGAYDWTAIGRLADGLKLPAPADPKAYAPKGQMETLLDWAVGQVNRYQLQLLFYANSTEWINGTPSCNLNYREALDRLGDVTMVTPYDIIQPGQQVEFTLAGLPASTGVQVDQTNGTYWFAYLDRDNHHHTIYLENAASLSDTLQLAAQYHLRGVDIRGLPDQTNQAPIGAIVQKFLGPAASSVESRYAVAWRVQARDGRMMARATVDLSQPNYQWQAPEAGGVFEVAASISSSQHTTTVPRGSVVILVATPTSTPSPTPTPTPTFTPSPTLPPTSAPSPTPTPTPESSAASELKPVQRTAPQPQRVALAPPAVASVKVPFGYGLQADPRGDTGANINHLHALGFTWVKLQMPWKDVEPSPGNYNWGLWDEIINAYSANGIQVLLSIPKAPDWARPPDDDKSVEGPPQDPGQYAGFVARVADRYRGKVQAIEIWNEQNLWYEAGGAGRINPANYVQLLQLSYQAIKAANPDMIVVSGALTPAGSVGDLAVDDLDYLNQMYANGVKGFFDALGAHPSGYNCPANGDWRTVQDPTAVNFHGPFNNRHHSWCFRGTLEGYREVMVAHGDGQKAIVPTEFGWAVSGQPQLGYEYARDNTPEEQAQWIVEAYQMAKSWGWVGPMFLWNLDYGVTAPGTELANFGILNTPAYNALTTMPK